MASKKFSFDDQVFLSIERLLRNSGRESWNLVSVCDEANKYCYKTVSGQIGTVDKGFIHDRVNEGIY